MPGVPKEERPSSPPDLASTAARALLAAKAEGQRTVASPMPAAPPITAAIHGLASVEGQSGRMLGDRVGPGQHVAGVVDVQVLDQAAVDHVNASRVSATATATIGCSSRRDGIHTDDDPRLPTTRLYRRQITAFDPSA